MPFQTNTRDQYKDLLKRLQGTGYASEEGTARVAELEQALKYCRMLAAAEQKAPTGLHMTCLSIIASTATLALAGCDTYELEKEVEQ